MMARVNKQNWLPAAMAILVIGAGATRAKAQSGGCCLPAQPATPAVQACVSLTTTDCTTQGGVYLGDFTGCKSPFYATPSSCDFVTYATGSNGAPNGGQVNISGATLFKAFFTQPASTNADCFQGGPVNGATRLGGAGCATVQPFCGFFNDGCGGVANVVNQLAPTWTCPSGAVNYFLVQYRGSGSAEGLVELVDYQLLGLIPTSIPADSGFINRRQWANLGLQVALAGCTPADSQGNGTTSDDSGTPVIPQSVDIDVSDVPALLLVQGGGTSTDALWNRKPTQDGYGRNPRLTSVGASNELPNLTRGAMSLNLNNNPPQTPAPDGNTLYNTPIAWVPIAAITNRGTGRENMLFSELQYLETTGRLPTGENLTAVTRDPLSGTKNGFDNSIGVDPSQGVGDNLGPRVNFSQETRVGVVPAPPAGTTFTLPVGSRTQPTNCGGSGVLEEAVKARRLAIGYTGLFGGRAASLQRAGSVEILNVAKDVDLNGNLIPGFVPSSEPGDPITQGCPNPDFNQNPGTTSGYIRPHVNNVLDNADPLRGWQIGGNESMITRGDPKSGLSGNTNPAVGSVNARDYVRNIASSIENFIAAPAQDNNNNMPGQFLSFSFALTRSVDKLPIDSNPTNYVANPAFDQSVQDFARCHNVDNPNAFGSVNVAGFVPFRNPRTGAGGPGGTYSDGSSDGSYRDFTGALGTVTNAKKLNRRNALAGDFNNDGLRNANDVAKLMEALKNPRLFTTNEGLSSATGGGDSPMNDDFVIPEIIGDFDGDGDFNALDARYFADGLALDPVSGKLNRQTGFTAIDNAWQTLMADGNYFDTQLATYPANAGYKAGDSRADIAGSVAGPNRGAYPNGSDGIVNAKDIDYVYANRGNWATLGQAVKIDLSADMNGDLVINQADVNAVVVSILCTRYGDANLDGSVNSADVTIVTNNQGMTPAGWADGDFNGDKVVDASDLAIVTANLGFAGPACGAVVCGDIDGNGARTSADIEAFANVLVGNDVDAAHVGRSDIDGNGTPNGLDAQPFVNCFLAP